MKFIAPWLLSFDWATCLLKGSPRSDRQESPSLLAGCLGPVFPKQIPPLVIVCTSACLGIVVDRLFSIFPEFWFLLYLGFFGGWFLLWALGFDRSASGLLLGSTAACFGLHHHLFWRYYPADELAFYVSPNAARVCLRALVIEEPRIKPPPVPTPMAFTQEIPTTVIGVMAREIRDGTRWVSVSGRASVFVQGEVPNLKAGDRIEVLGELVAFSPQRNPGEADFSLDRRSSRSLSLVYAPFPACVKKVGVMSRRTPQLILARVKGHHNEVLQRFLSPQAHGLVTALLLGIREGIDAEIASAFRETGVLHFLAISGLHVTLLGGLACVVAYSFFRRWRVAVAFVAMWIGIYMALTDTRASILRGGTLFWFGAIGELLGRSSWGFNTLAASALVVLWLRPADLFRVGAHLTFLGTAALMWFSRGLLRPQGPAPFEWLTVRPGPLAIYCGRVVQLLAEIFQTSVCVSLIVGPYCAWRFNLVPVISPVMTVLLWPLVLSLMIAGLGLVVSYAVFPPLAYLPAFVCEILTSAMYHLAAAGRQIPGAFFWTPSPPGWWILGFYLIVGLVATVPALRKAGRVAVVVGVWICGGLIGSLCFQKITSYRCTFLSVGHGLVTVIQAPGAPAILYDAGSLRHPQAVGVQISTTLWSLGVTRIGAIILSHPDRDHYNLVPEIVRRFPVQRVFVGPSFGAALGAAKDRPGDPEICKDEASVVLALRQPWYYRWLPPLRWSGYLPPVFVEGSPDTRDFWAQTHDPGNELGVAMLREILRKASIPVSVVAAGDIIRLEDDRLKLEVLLALDLPERNAVIRPGQHDNAASLVVGAEIGGVRVLLTGDLEPPGTAELLNQPPWPCDVLLAPHHGSLTTQPQRLLVWAQPRTVVISGGRRWFRPAALTAWSDAGAAVFHTYLHGAILIEPPRQVAQGPTEPSSKSPLVVHYDVHKKGGFRLHTYSSGRWVLQGFEGHAREP